MILILIIRIQKKVECLFFTFYFLWLISNFTSLLLSENIPTIFENIKMTLKLLSDYDNNEYYVIMIQSLKTKKYSI